MSSNPSPFNFGTPRPVVGNKWCLSPASAAASGKHPRFEDPSTLVATPTNERQQRKKGVSNKKSKVSKGVNFFHLKKVDLPEGSEGIQKSFNFHLSLMLNCLSSIVPVSAPTEEDLQHFQNQYKGNNYVDSLLKNLQTSQPAKQSELDVFLATLAAAKEKYPDSTITRKASLMDNHHLTYIFSAITLAGLHRWIPDVLGQHGSAYNTVHQMVAIQTYKDVAGAFGYSHLFKVEMQHLQNDMLLRSLYLNFVWCFLPQQAKRSKLGAKQLEQDAKHTNAYKRRKELADGRTMFLKREAYPKRVWKLTEDPNAHSDDEREVHNGEELFVATRKNGRAKHVGDFFHWIDSQRKTIALLEKRRTKAAKMKRIIPSDDQIKDSELESLPKNVPVDFFNPSFFDSLPLSVQAEYKGTALPWPANEDIKTNPLFSTPAGQRTWKFLTDDKFMEQIGATILNKYAIPTPEELEAIEHYKQLAEEETEDDEEEEEEEEIYNNLAGPQGGRGEGQQDEQGGNGGGQGQRDGMSIDNA